MAVQSEASSKMLEKHELGPDQQFKHTAPGRIKLWISTDRAPAVGTRILCQEMTYARCIGMLPKGQAVWAERVGRWLRLHQKDGCIHMGPWSRPLMQLCPDEGEEVLDRRNFTRRAPNVKRKRVTDGTQAEPPNALVSSATISEGQVHVASAPHQQLDREGETSTQAAPSLTAAALQQWCQQFDALTSSSRSSSSVSPRE